MPQSRPPQTTAAQPRPDGDFAVIGIGASAGGLDACSRLLAAMPDGGGMAFILVQHLDPTHESMLVDLLAGRQWQCEQAGSEDLDGRPAVKVTMTSPTGVKRTGWIDAELKFPLRIETADGAMIALRNIVEAPQSPHLFEIAGSFRKYDPAQLIARIKQSDVWVEPVK